jgi:hypothetical protein
VASTLTAAGSSEATTVRALLRLGDDERLERELLG